jgi:hypothetical protein
MFDKAMRKSIEPYLEPGEEVLALVLGQSKGAGKAMVLGGAVGAAAHAMRNRGAGGDDGGAPVVRLASRMGVAVTSKRLLIFKGGGQLSMKAKELLTELPVSSVDRIEVGKGMVSTPITVVVGDESFTFEAPRAQPSADLPRALEQARGVSAV